MASTYTFSQRISIAIIPRLVSLLIRMVSLTLHFEIIREPGAQSAFERERPCTLLIDEIESIWSAIAERDDWSPFEAKVAEIRAIPVQPLVAAGTFHQPPPRAT